MKRYMLSFAAAAALVAVSSLVPTSARAACIVGGALSNLDDCITASKGGNDCLMVWHVDGDGLGNPPLDKKGNVTKAKIECVDGDACDADGIANGVCTFRFGACVNATGTTADGKTCNTANLTTLEFKKPSAKEVANAIKTPEAVFTRRTIASEVGSTLLPTSTEMCTSENLELRVPLRTKKGACNSPAGLKCTGDSECDDYCVLSTKKGKSIVKATVSDGASTKDSDALKFFCLPAAAGAPSAQALELAASAGATTADLIGGPLALARMERGDRLLRNGQVRVIIEGPGRVAGANFFQQGGHIIDADIVRSDPSQDRDSWSGEQTMINLANTQATDTVVVLNDGSNGAPAIVRTSGPDTLISVLQPDVAINGTGSAGGVLSVPLDTVDVDLPVTLQTDYILKGDADYVQEVTTVFNTAGTDLALYVGEYLNPSGQVEPFGPGLGFGNALIRNGRQTAGSSTQALQHLSFQGRQDAVGVTYGTIFDSNDQAGPVATSSFVQSGVFTWVQHVPLLDLLLKLQPGKPSAQALQVPGNGSNSFRRWFVVGKTIADVTKARTEIFAEDEAAIQGTVTVNGQPAPGARVAILKGVGAKGSETDCIAGVNCKDVFSATTTDEQGFYRVFVPAGGYQVAVRAKGTPYDTGTSAPSEVQVDVKKKKTGVVDFDLPATGKLQVVTKDQSGAFISAKVSIVGVPASPDPENGSALLGGAFQSFGRYFGSVTDNRDFENTFGLADIRFTTLTGDTGAFDIEPGTYQIVVSHGPEYDAFVQRVTIGVGATTTVNATVTHVIDTSGYVSIDTHVHTLRSADSHIAERDRVITMLAEGVDFFASTDHGFVTDFSPTITALGADSVIKTVASEETTTFSYGHYNIWPQTVDPTKRAGGAFDWGNANGFPSGGVYNIEPATMFSNFNTANQVIQINHFNSSTLGQFSLFGMDFESVPPMSAQTVYQCTGVPQSASSARAGLPCRPFLCSGGTDDGLSCAGGCPGGSCMVGTEDEDCPTPAAIPNSSNCEPIVGSLGSLIRLDPAITNLYADNYTSIEMLIEANRPQIDLLLTDNLSDWAGLLNQGSFKTGVADSDTHHTTEIQAGGPRSYVASNAPNPGSIDPTVLAQTVNAGRVVGSNAPFMHVTLTGAASATASLDLGSPLTVAAAGGGADSITVDVESPTWAEFDTIEIYVNTVPSCVSAVNFLGAIGRDCTVAPTFSIPVTPTTVAGLMGSNKLVASVTQPVTVTADSWVIVIVKGTDGVSRPLFPMNPQNLDHTGNTSLDALTDSNGSLPWNLGENGVLTVAFSNPLFFDVGGDGVCNNGSPCP